MDKIKKYLNTPIGRSAYILSYLGTMAVVVVLSYFLHSIHAPSVSVRTLGKVSLPSQFSFPILAILVTIFVKVLDYKRFSDFWNKKKAMGAVAIIILCNVFNMYVLYFTDSNNTNAVVVDHMLTFLALILVFIAVFKKESPKVIQQQ